MPPGRPGSLSVSTFSGRRCRSHGDIFSSSLCAPRQRVSSGHSCSGHSSRMGVLRIGSCVGSQQGICSPLCGCRIQNLRATPWRPVTCVGVALLGAIGVGALWLAVWVLARNWCGAAGPDLMWTVLLPNGGGGVNPWVGCLLVVRGKVGAVALPPCPLSSECLRLCGGGACRCLRRFLLCLGGVSSRCGGGDGLWATDLAGDSSSPSRDTW